MLNYYFIKEPNLYNRSAHIVGFMHSSIPNNTLPKIETIYIDLTKTEEELYTKLHRSNRKQINKASSYGFHIEVLTQPAIEDIREFQTFYNQFAKQTKTYSCDSFHLSTMRLLADQNALIITKLLNESEVVQCYRVYISDGDIAFSLYSASHFRLSNKTEEKRKLSEGSRYLLWRNILYFKEHNHLTYDMGGLTTNENIWKFKMEFGGEVIAVYSGYEANSMIGKLVLWLRSVKMTKG